MPCVSCGVASAAPQPSAVSDAQSAGQLAPLSSATSCAERASLKKQRLAANPSRRPGLRRRRGIRFRKPDPCNPEVDPVTARLTQEFLGTTNPDTPQCNSRVCKVPSLFTAVTARGAEEECYALGFKDALADENSRSRGRGGICTQGLGGGGTEQRFGQLCTPSRNLLQRPYTFCRQSSLFTCTTDRCQASLCVELGATDVLPTQGQRNYNAGCTAGLGGGRGPGNKTFQDICVRVTRFGNNA